MKTRIKRVSILFIIVFFTLIFVAVYFNMEMKKSLEQNIVYKLENDIHSAADEVSEYLFGMTELTRQMSIDKDFIDIIKTAETVDDVESFISTNMYWIE